MQGRTSAGKASPASLAPMAAVAAGVVALALAVSGVLWRSDTGTIVIQRTQIASLDAAAHPRATRVSVTTITQTSAGGQGQRTLLVDSLLPLHYQQVIAGDSIELYDPSDNTIYVATDQALQRAQVQQMQRDAPAGSKVSSVHGSSVSFSYSAAPMSVLQRLRAGIYRVTGRTTVDGRAALELVPTKPYSIAATAGRPGAHQIFGTVYASPATFHPIKQVVSFGGLTSTTT